jgi:hypothetical protein
MAMRGGIVRVAILAIGVAACSAQPSANPPTLAEAQAFLVEIVALAQRGDFEVLCDMSGDGNCERKLDEAGRDRVPPDGPTIKSVRIVPTTKSGDQTSLGGLVLVMCGIDGLGSPYASEMLVFRDGSATLRAINPIYWGTYTIASGGRTITSPTRTAEC